MHLTAAPAPRRTAPVLARLRRFTRRDDSGFTLVELLVAIIIMGIITAPLATGLILFFQRSGDTTQRLAVDHDVQIVSTYWAQDIQTLGRRDWTTLALKAPAIELPHGGAGTYRCGPTSNWYVHLLSDATAAAPSGPPAAPTQVVVAYAKEVVGGENQLHRVVCRGSTTVSDTVMAHDLSSVAITCASPSNCESTSSVPQTVTLKLVLKDNSTTDTVTLIGQRRQT
ncbi:MAG TPA: prepilin-type N-terminal cleavage/methylation domain-containing protein [Rugosimonospora sp.]|nr:prepilin-type N-terminal cleavage/methylation domain-containing protein [Rugosimonospora sp.]